MTVREEICRFIMGKAASSWATTFETLTPSQISGCIDALDKFPDNLADVLELKQIMQGWIWFRMAKLATKPPWEMTAADVKQLHDLAPWNPTGQMALFE